ncbi:MAG: hypothetical protein BGP24_11140 [Lysobacterales bacterium 69-70]|nr:MAG: hypothetical protein ABS97_20910 [Xanthomonadaceae bacterium SCN 69-320]ODV22110.1 MAG: hypothetical protein ABT27_02285 [Xanthomonadaceae bacterium SCN 69-25]OJY98371.1 MAG: hypothetical protein BGP24_11140 [Xanthomonadales bacterium 69-70]
MIRQWQESVRIGDVPGGTGHRQRADYAGATRHNDIRAVLDVAADQASDSPDGNIIPPVKPNALRAGRKHSGVRTAAKLGQGKR